MIKVVTVLPSTHVQPTALPPPIPNLDTHPLIGGSGAIITELSDDPSPDIMIGNELSDNHSDTLMNQTNSNFINKSSSRLLTRQLSFGSKSTDLPNVPKRNQPATLSAPSTLTKKLEPDDKKEIYV